MPPISYARHQFPPEVIQPAVCLYLRFTLSYRDVEDLLANRGLEMSYETVRRWVVKFGPTIARHLRQRRPRPSPRWHLNEMAVRIGGERVYLWRAVEDEGEVLDVLVQRRRDKAAAGSCCASSSGNRASRPPWSRSTSCDPMRPPSPNWPTARHEQSLRKNNRAKVSHQPVRRRKRKMRRGTRHRRREVGPTSRAFARRLGSVTKPPAPPDLR
jgi:transposase-like protein